VGRVERRSGEYTTDGGVGGVRLTARSGEGRFEAFTDGEGNYEILGVPPGQYKFKLQKSGFVPEEEFNRFLNETMRVDQKLNMLMEDYGSVDIPPQSCGVWNPAMWPNGRILGSVRNAKNEPLEDIPVQAFGFKNGQRDWRVLRTARSDKSGNYVLDRLPQGEYVVGVNAGSHDESAYPLFEYSRDGGEPTRLYVHDAEDLPGVILRLGEPRTKARLQLNPVDQDGNPVTKALVILETVGRQQQIIGQGDDKALVDVPVFVGEKYFVKVYGEGGEGTAHVAIGAEKETMTVVLVKERN
jgi:hypothetical protein